MPPSRPVPGTDQRLGLTADAVQDAAGRLHLLVGLGPRGKRDVRVHDLGVPGAPVVSRSFPDMPFQDRPVALGVGPDGGLHLAAVRPR